MIRVLRSHNACITRCTTIATTGVLLNAASCSLCICLLHVLVIYCVCNELDSVRGWWENDRISRTVDLMLRVRWTEHRTDDSIHTELNATRQLLGGVMHRKLSFFRHTIRDGGCELVKCVTTVKWVGSEGAEDQRRHAVVTSQNGCHVWKHGANHEGNTGSRWMEKIGTMCGTGGWSSLPMGPRKKKNKLQVFWSWFVPIRETIHWLNSLRR